MPSMCSEIDKMLSVMPENEQQLAFEVVKRLYLAWGGKPQTTVDTFRAHMTASEAIRTAMKEAKITQNDLAELMGYNSQGTVGNALRSNNFTTNTFIRWLDCLDYEVVVQPKTSGKRKEGSIVLDPSGLPDGRGKKQKKEVESAE